MKKFISKVRNHLVQGNRVNRDYHGKKIKAVIFEIVILKLKILAIHWFTRLASIRVADKYIDVALEN